jgi:hypothetical protein
LNEGNLSLLNLLGLRSDVSFFAVAADELKKNLKIDGLFEDSLEYLTIF